MPDPKQIEGRLYRFGFAREVFLSFLGLVLCLIMASVLGYFALQSGIALVYQRDVEFPHSLLPLLFLTFSVWMMVVARQEYYRWLNTVLSFRYDGRFLEYRTLLKQKTYCLPVDKIVWVLTHHPYSLSKATAPHYFIWDIDRKWLDLNPRLLHNTAELAKLLRKQAVRNRIDHCRESAPTGTVGPDHPLMPQVIPHLQADEAVYWLGEVDRPRLLKPQTDQCALGFAVSQFFSLVAIVGLIAYLSVPSLSEVPVAIVVIMTMLPLLLWPAAVLGQRRVAAIEQQVAKSVYVVTSHRALVIDGFYWRVGFCLDGSSTRFWYGHEFGQWSPAELMNYECPGDRDIILGSQWVKRSPLQPAGWWLQGFLAPNDRSGARLAIIRLLDEHINERHHVETSTL